MSYGSLLLIVLVALIVIKPERAPEIAYFLGRTVARLRVWYTAILTKYTNP